MFTQRQIREASEAFTALQIKPTNSKAAIRKAYLKRVKEVHPDFLGGSTDETAQVNSAYGVLEKHHEDKTLADIVSTLREESESELVEEIDDFASRPQRPSGNRETAIPHYKDVAVLDYVGGGEFTLYLYGERLRSNLNPRAAVRTLMSIVGPNFQGSMDDIYVWVFVRNNSMQKVTLSNLGEALYAAIPPEAPEDPAASTRRATSGQPGSGGPAPRERPNTEEQPPEGLVQIFRSAEWRGKFLGYVLVQERGNVRVFRLTRTRGQVDATYFGAYQSSAVALREMNKQGLNPDIVPVWLLSDVLGPEPKRLGVA